MRRREVIALIGGAAAWPFTAWAQQRPSIPAVGFLNAGLRSDADLSLQGFRKGLRELGYVEGQNIHLEYRFGENRVDRYSTLAAELVRANVAVIAASPGGVIVQAAHAVTKTVPIVFMSGADPVRIGLVASLNHPGGNITGVTLLSADLTARRIGLLHESLPQGVAIAVLLDARDDTNESPEFQLREALVAASKIGRRIIAVRVVSDAEFPSAFEAAKSEGAGALLVSATGFFVNHRDLLVALSAKHRLPAIYQQREYVTAGGLMSYGPRMLDAYRQVGVYVGRILKGEKAADLPVVLPTRFEFVINMRSAKALDLSLSPGILAIADEVIE